MPKRHNNIIYKPFFRSKTIIAILSNITRTRLIVYIKDPKEAPSVNYVYIEDTKIGEITVVNIVTTTHPIRSNTISVISLDVG
jgi:hypothetical protein